jgi:hypothetical protein
MKKQIVTNAISIALAVLLVFGAMSWVNGVPSTRAQEIPGGIIGGGQPITLMNGTRGYTTSINYSSPLEAKFYGSIQVAVAIVGTGVVTVTPQFSLQEPPCSQATQWFTSTTYIPYQPYSIATSSTTLTETIGAWEKVAVKDKFSVSAGNVGFIETAGSGTCFRVMLTYSAAGSTFTPTVIGRPLNRN